METFYQTPFFDPAKAISALNEGIFVENWRQAGIRVLRAQERLLGGLMNAARLEVEFSRELMASRMGSLQWEGGFAQVLTERPRQDVARLTTLIREVNEEVSSGFREAAKLLMKDEVAISAVLTDEETVVSEVLADEVVLAGEEPGIVLEDVLAAAAVEPVVIPEPVAPVLIPKTVKPVVNPTPAAPVVSPEPVAPLKVAAPVVTVAKAAKKPLVQPKKALPLKRRGK